MVAFEAQIILYAEGVKESNGTQFDKADIDGKFGAADDKWNSSTRAGELEYRSTGSTSATKYKVRYHGSRYYFDIFRTSDGKYRIYHNSQWQYASYKNNSSCS
ncbi:hypothetical protein [Streptomyces sp. RG80]|uniref:hypothetical protein n=1 Tax=Streptomyces sp. RG80 TaxID=3157340 RepID=UPI00338FE55C